jgi:Thiol:disulfide interchange protein DsbD, N-terminal
MKTVLALFLMAQLVAPNVTIPQVMSAKFSSAAPIKAGRKANLTVSFDLKKGYKINREPTISLDITPVNGVKLDAKSIEASSIDKKSKDEYYVDLPTLTVGLTAAKAGKYELPGKLTYFFCSTSDGFCSKQTVDVKIPLQVE